MDSPDEMLITSLLMGLDGSRSMGFVGDPLRDSLQLDMIGDDGRDKVLSLVDCFAFCLLLRVTLAYGNLAGLSMALLVRLSLDGDVIGDE